MSILVRGSSGGSLNGNNILSPAIQAIQIEKVGKGLLNTRFFREQMIYFKDVIYSTGYGGYSSYLQLLINNKDGTTTLLEQFYIPPAQNNLTIYDDDNLLLCAAQKIILYNITNNTYTTISESNKVSAYSVNGSSCINGYCYMMDTYKRNLYRFDIIKNTFTFAYTDESFKDDTSFIISDNKVDSTMIIEAYNTSNGYDNIRYAFIINEEDSTIKSFDYTNYFHIVQHDYLLQYSSFMYKDTLYFILTNSDGQSMPPSQRDEYVLCSINKFGEFSHIGYNRLVSFFSIADNNKDVYFYPMAILNPDTSEIYTPYATYDFIKYKYKFDSLIKGYEIYTNIIIDNENLNKTDYGYIVTNDTSLDILCKDCNYFTIINNGNLLYQVFQNNHEPRYISGYCMRGQNIKGNIITTTGYQDIILN